MSQNQTPALRIQKNQQTTTITLSNEDLKEFNLPALSEQLFGVAAQLTEGTLEVDMKEVTYLTSTALGKFVGLHKRVREQGARLVLSNLRDEVYEIFEVTQLHRILTLQQASSDDDGTEGATPLAS